MRGNRLVFSLFHGKIRVLRRHIHIVGRKQRENCSRKCSAESGDRGGGLHHLRDRRERQPLENPHLLSRSGGAGCNDLHGSGRRERADNCLKQRRLQPRRPVRLLLCVEDPQVPHQRLHRVGLLRPLFHQCILVRL